MNKDHSPDSVYTDLDTLFDTRLPILYALDHKVPSAMLADGTYHTRVRDNFKHISLDIFKPYYANRGKPVLGLATVSRIVSTIHSYLIETTANRKLHGSTSSLDIFLNIYPYTLSIDEQEAMSSGLSKQFGGLSVVIMNKSPSELSPRWLSRTVGIMFAYGGMEWLELHVSDGSLPSCPLMDIQLVVPAIVSGTVRTKDVTNKTFEDMMVGMSSLITLSMVKVSEFCVTVD